jgi:acetoin utilization deacetylase AcuC-like enzyme
MRFQPHLVIISAGFDAHRSDPLANCHLNEEDFRWATELIVEVSAE